MYPLSLISGRWLMQPGWPPLRPADYLIVITARKRVARILNTDIYQATNFGIYPINAAPKGPAEHVAQVAPEESYLLGLLKASVTSSPFFYTHGPYDLTNRLQKQSDPAGQQVPLYERADDRFFWNKHLMSRFIETTARGSADVSTLFQLAKVVFDPSNLTHWPCTVEQVHLAPRLWL